MTVTLKRMGKKPFFCVVDEEGEPLGLIDFDAKSKLSLFDGCCADREELLSEIAESEKRIARSHSMFLLSRRDYSSGELVTKLTELPVSEEAARSAVERLCELGYINDSSFAGRVASHYVKGGYGPMKLRAELRRKGFDSETAEQALCETQEANDFIASARAVAEKKYGDLTSLTYEEKGKISAYLARRGFTYEQINRALSE